MKIIDETNIHNCLIIELNKFSDNRGLFTRIFDKEFCKDKLNFDIKQSSISTNNDKGVFRGLHYQKSPFAENKIISCINGSIYDVIVDIDKSSKTFGNVFQMRLSSKDNYAIFIPKSCAHGFLTLERNSSVYYSMDNIYSKNHATGINWNDKKLNIKFPITPKIISDKDNLLPIFDKSM